MAEKEFLSIVNGQTTLVKAVSTPAGTANAGDIVAYDSTGHIKEEALPSGVGAATVVAPAVEALGAGSLVNLFDDGGSLGVRLADNSNARPAHGFVKVAFDQAATATIYRLGVTNAQLSGLTIAIRYYLGTAGAVTDTPLDPQDDDNTGKIHQHVGFATSATELNTVDDLVVVL